MDSCYALSPQFCAWVYLLVERLADNCGCWTTRVHTSSRSVYHVEHSHCKMVVYYERSKLWQLHRVHPVQKITVNICLKVLWITGILPVPIVHGHRRNHPMGPVGRVPPTFVTDCACFSDEISIGIPYSWTIYGF